MRSIGKPASRRRRDTARAVRYGAVRACVQWTCGHVVLSIDKGRHELMCDLGGWRPVEPISEDDGAGQGRGWRPGVNWEKANRVAPCKTRHQTPDALGGWGLGVVGCWLGVRTQDPLLLSPRCYAQGVGACISSRFRVLCYRTVFCLDLKNKQMPLLFFPSHSFCRAKDSAPQFGANRALIPKHKNKNQKKHCTPTQSQSRSARPHPDATRQ